MKTILFVCTGNICRSPMAAALARDRLAARGLGDQVQVLSAGVWAEDGYPASRNAVTVLGQRGIDLTAHASRTLTVTLLREADIVLVMEEDHRKSIFYLAPQFLSKIFLLTEMAGEHDDIPDPYGGRPEEYAETADQLTRLIDRGLPRILKRLGISEASANAA